MKVTNKDFLAKNLLSKKRNDVTEIFITFFEYCDLACSFCWQDHNDKRGIDTILAKVSDVSQLIESSGTTDIHVNMMGGELFSDVIPYRCFSDYHQFCQEVEDIATRFGKNCQFNFVSNLIFQGVDRVLNLLKSLRKQIISPVHITTSFDFCGRFAPKTLELFKSNLILFENYVDTVSVVLTSQNIEALLKDNNECFKDIYQSKATVYFDTYSPQSRAAQLTPSDSQMQQAYLFLIDNYPECEPVRTWMKREPAKLSCMSSKIVNHEGFVGQCGAIVKKSELENYNVDIDASTNHGMEAHFIEKNECLSCQFFTRCSLGCFLLHGSKMKVELNECLFKGVHRRIDRVTNQSVFFREG